MRILTLLSDFGARSPYPAAMKAVVAARGDAQFVDISHDVRRHDVRGGAFLRASVAPFCPTGTVHLAVVDPGVGTARRPLVVVAGGQCFVGPDNGLAFPGRPPPGAPPARPPPFPRPRPLPPRGGAPAAGRPSRPPRPSH